MTIPRLAASLAGSQVNTIRSGDFLLGYLLKVFSKLRNLSSDTHGRTVARTHTGNAREETMICAFDRARRDLSTI